MIEIVKSNHEKILKAALSRRKQGDRQVRGDVEAIITEVRTRGDAAVRELTGRFDKHAFEEHEGGSFRLSPRQISRAAADCADDVRAALGVAASRIRDFHQHTLPKDFRFTDAQGVEMGYRYSAIAAAGVYVPGGLAAYPSSVLMNCIPAQVAGVERLVLCTPTPDRYCHPAVMAAIEILELSEVYAIGGAQAIAAMAYGTETLTAVDFIAGPGNAYVASAKGAVFGTVGIDSLAGPSEVTVVADAGASARHVAWDLLAQAEHDRLAQSIVISDDESLLQGVAQELGDILPTLPRADIAGASWREQGLMLLVDRLEDAVVLLEMIAPEHLILATAEPEELFSQIRHAGSVFLGYHTPEAIGDYLSGPNHVLPTSGSARFASGLSCHSFMKHTSFQQIADKQVLAKIAPEAMVLAEAEGLHAHRLSIAKRLE